MLEQPQPDNMPAKKPTEEELLALEDKYGMAAFLDLRNVDWSKDPKAAEQPKKDADELIRAGPRGREQEAERPGKDSALRQEPQRRP